MKAQKRKTVKIQNQKGGGIYSVVRVLKMPQDIPNDVF
jgi:hypothetical protein